VQLPHAFYKFPFQFDAERMRAEIDAIPEECWRWHHEGFEGNSALPLISTNGGMNDDFAAPMMRTEFLERMPYVMQVLSQFRTLHGRARLMRIEPHAGVPPHVDIQYYWRTHTRVHIPVVTDPGIRFHCGNQDVHMAAGEAWTFDNWRLHKVVNETDTRRIHLTFDTYGSTAFWGLARPWPGDVKPIPVAFDPGAKPQLVLESYVGPAMLAPAELEIEFARFIHDVASHPRANRAAIAKLDGQLYALRNEWKMLWYSRGPSDENVRVFLALLQRASQDIFASLPSDTDMSSNGAKARQVLESIFTAMVRAPKESMAAPAVQTGGEKFDRPVFIVSAPRSGSTLLFETLSASEDLWTIGGEGHGHVESIAGLAPQSRNFESNRLTADDATGEVVAQLRTNYWFNLQDKSGQLLRERKDGVPESVRFLEKTPKNALRIPFLKSVFHDAKFIFLHRGAPENVSSIMEAWRTGAFVTYPDLPGWQGRPWSLLLIPGWRELIGADPAAIAMRQWTATNATILDDLSTLPPEDWYPIRYEDFIADVPGTLKRLGAFIGIPFGAGLRSVASRPLKPSVHTFTPPDPEKWRSNEAAIGPVLCEGGAVAKRLALLPDPLTLTRAAQ
jgi:hypothetical protein